MRALFASVLVAVMSCSLLAQNTAQVTVWLYRPNVDNLSSAVTLYVDGRKLLNLDHGRFFGIQLSPGLHAFNWTNQPGAQQIVVPLGPDLLAYFEVTFMSGAPFLSINPLPVDKALQAMTGLRPIDPNGVFDYRVIVPAQELQAAVKAPSADPENNAKPASVTVPAQNAAATSSASVLQIASSRAGNVREKTPKKDAARNVSSKTEKEALVVKAVTQESNVVTTPGAADTLCVGNSTAIRSLTVDNVNCSTTSNPPQQHKVILFRPLVNKVQAENGKIYTISCSPHWIVSKCGPMTDGDSFKADVEKKTMWITAHKDGNSWQDVLIKYEIVDIQ